MDGKSKISKGYLKLGDLDGFYVSERSYGHLDAANSFNNKNVSK